MNNENNNFNNETNEPKTDSLNNSNEPVNETPINYNAVSGSKEYIYGNTYDEKKDKKPKKRILSTIAIVLVAALIGGATGGFATALYYRNSNSNIGNNNTTNNKPIVIDINSNTYFAAAVNEKAKDTVVGITTMTKEKVETFFGGIQEQERQSIGSGVIVDSDGLILTNSHVIGDGNATSITVMLTDGTTEEGQVLWFSSTLDLAVIKIDRKGLNAAELGNSDELLVGEPVVAIGNPMSLDLNGTVTQGIISGLNRSITIENTTIKPLIQTDASINPGNSGGPLFNARGEVIGINTAKMSTAEGLGFSIPINVAIPILEQISDKGKVSSVYIGIKGTGVQDYERRLGIDLTPEYGVIAVEIEKDGPVHKAGLQAGDVIINIDGTKIETMNDLQRILYKYKIGDVIKLTYLRDGSETTVDVTLKERPVEQ